jgi:hypothetical protein
MRTDAEIRSEGIRLLASGLGIVEAERFIALMHRERFDYTPHGSIFGFTPSQIPVKRGIEHPRIKT